MAHQSPMISIPKKTTEEVDWTTPIRHLIAQSYGENPDTYAAECAQLQRCRQDAVRGAGSDITAKDLLYKYFGQLELLELRFPEIKVSFPWHDAFTSKITTQSSLAYEKASILFLIASTHSSLASQQSRADPEGLKRAFWYFRTSAGMLGYINENFLHAPSIDLGRDVVKFLTSLILAQATEVFYEKCVDEKKGSGLVAKVASQAGGMYTTLNEEVKEFMGKGIFDRNWVILIQIKAKYFTSLSQHHRALADSSASKHGDAFARYALSDSLAKEALKLSNSFSPSLSPTLPADAGPCLLGLTKAHAALAASSLATAIRENDLIYNALAPAPEVLPKIDGLTVATPVPIHEVYGAPEVQKTIGPDLFGGLLPLSVHESASVYSEEKAKVVRGEVERAEIAEAAVKSALDEMGVVKGLGRFRAMAEGSVGGGEEVPLEVRRAREEVEESERAREGNVQGMLAELGKRKEKVAHELNVVGRDLEVESRECEELRVRWEHRWTQDPSAGLSKPLRTELKSHLASLEAAGMSDNQVVTLWNEVGEDIALLQRQEVETLFAERAGSGGEHLLDLDVGTEEGDAIERAKIGGFVAEIEERLSRLNKIARERIEILKELKDKIQTDDVSHLLLLNRRNTGVEPTLFAAELEKFRPYQHRLSSTLTAQDTVLSEIRTLWSGLREHAGRGPGARRWDERERRKRDTARRFCDARDGYMQVRDGILKGLQFYKDLGGLVDKLRAETRVFVTERKEEREKAVRKLEEEARKSEGPKPPLAAKPLQGLEKSFAGINLGASSPGTWKQQPPPPPQQYASPSQYSSPPPPPSHAQSPPLQYNRAPTLPPPPPQPTNQSQYLSHTSPPPQQYQQPSPQAQPYQPQTQQPSFLPPPPPRPVQTSFAPPPLASDPYASLGIFDARAPQPPPPPSSQPVYGQQYGQAPPPQPPQPPQPQSYQGYASAPSGYQSSAPGPSQQSGAYSYLGQTQQQSGGAFPPPPPHVQQYQQQQGYQYTGQGQGYGP